MYTGGWYDVREALRITREKTGFSKVSELHEQHDESLET
jgi:hypothetical protein